MNIHMPVAWKPITGSSVGKKGRIVLLQHSVPCIKILHFSVIGSNYSIFSLIEAWNTRLPIIDLQSSQLKINGIVVSARSDEFDFRNCCTAIKRGRTTCFSSFLSRNNQILFFGSKNPPALYLPIMAPLLYIDALTIYAGSCLVGCM